ncbi:MAG: ATP-binding cassette domain-containing protein [Bacillota bacterium]|nr:ATP-binding cassette domain-containing protein [Bacillota bacterium]
MQPAIQTFGITRRFGDLVAVDGLDLTVEPGEILALLGPNGSGKTTVINMLSGLLRPTKGRCLVAGLDPVTDPVGVRRRLGVCHQETLLYDELTGRENLCFAADLYGLPPALARRRAGELLELMGLSHRQHDRVGTYSGGMQRRLALARALLADPPVTVLDEPTLGVDVQARAAIWDYIRLLAGQGKAVMLTTNYMEEAEALAHRIAVIDRGRRVALGTPEELKDLVGGDIIETELAGDAAAFAPAVRQLPGVRGVSAQASRLTLTAQDGATLLPKVLALLSDSTTVRAASLRRPSLNDTFLQLTGRELRD